MAKSWWDDLTVAQQRAYLAEHPNSKRKVSARKGGTRASSSASDLPPVPPLPRPSAQVLKDVFNHVKSNPKQLALALTPLLLGGQSRYNRDVDDTDPKENSRLALIIRTAIGANDSVALKKLSGMMGVRTGIALVAVVGLSVALGTDLTLFLPYLAHDFWSDVQEADSAPEYLKNVGVAYVNKVKESLGIPSRVARASTTAAPTTVIDDVEPSETASISIASGHETDLNRALVSIEKLNVEHRTNVLLDQPARGETAVAALLDQVTLLEDGMPKLASILVASVPQRLSLSRRAKAQLNLFRQQLDRCHAELARRAERKPLPVMPLGQLVRTQLRTETAAREVAYVRCEHGQIRLCEHHTLTGVQVGKQRVEQASVWGYWDQGSLHIAATRDGRLRPRSFESISARGLRGWFREAGLKE